MNQQNKPRTHLFSPHTDQCVYCGKSAQHDAIENAPCGSDQPLSCGACSGKGWLWCIAEGDHPPREEIQRCDACQKFANDQAALEAVEACYKTLEDHSIPCSDRTFYEYESTSIR